MLHRLLFPSSSHKLRDRVSDNSLVFLAMDSMIWSLVRFLNGENQNYGVTIQQGMIQGDYFKFIFIF